MLFWCIFASLALLAFVFNRLYLSKVSWMRRYTALVIQHAFFVLSLAPVSRYGIELGVLNENDFLDSRVLFLGCMILLAFFGLLALILLMIDFLFPKKAIAARDRSSMR